MCVQVRKSSCPRERERGRERWFFLLSTHTHHRAKNETHGTPQGKESEAKKEKRTQAHALHTHSESKNDIRSLSPLRPWAFFPPAGRSVGLSVGSAKELTDEWRHSSYLRVLCSFWEKINIRVPCVRKNTYNTRKTYLLFSFFPCLSLSLSFSLPLSLSQCLASFTYTYFWLPRCVCLHVPCVQATRKLIFSLSLSRFRWLLLRVI